MKLKIQHIWVIAVSAVLTSCYSSRPLGDDDLYVMKNSTLPPGESLTDETSYSTYKYREHRDQQADSYYYSRDNYFFRPNITMVGWYPYDSWGMYGYRNSFMIGYNYGFMGQPYGFYPFYDPFMYNPYFYRPNFFYGPYGYGPMYGFGPMYGYGPFYGNQFYNCPSTGIYGNNNFGNNFNNGGFNSVNSFSNSYSGPRGSISGISNPQGRQYAPSNPGSNTYSSPIYMEKRQKGTETAAHQSVRPASMNRVIVDDKPESNSYRNSRNMQVEQPSRIQPRNHTMKSEQRSTQPQRNYSRSMERNPNAPARREYNMERQQQPMQRHEARPNSRMESGTPNTIRGNSNSRNSTPQNSGSGGNRRN